MNCYVNQQRKIMTLMHHQKLSLIESLRYETISKMRGLRPPWLFIADIAGITEFDLFHLVLRTRILSAGSGQKKIKCLGSDPAFRKQANSSLKHMESQRGLAETVAVVWDYIRSSQSCVGAAVPGTFLGNGLTQGLQARVSCSILRYVTSWGKRLACPARRWKRNSCLVCGGRE